MATCKEKIPSTSSSPGPRERFLLSPPPCEPGLSMDWTDHSKNRRRSTIHSYTIAVYHTLPKNPRAMKEVRAMTSGKAAKNLITLSLSFMFIYTGFVSLQNLHSTLHPHGGLGVVSLSAIYGTSVLSCLVAPWLINRLTTKWTMVMGFSFFTAYFASTYYPTYYLVLPLSVLLGALAGPMWSAQATYVTTLALTYAQHRRIVLESDDVINQFMGVFFGFYRSSQFLGNLISTLILKQNTTDASSVGTFTRSRSSNQTSNNSVLSPVETPSKWTYLHSKFYSYDGNLSNNLCGASVCSYGQWSKLAGPSDGTFSFDDIGDTTAISDPVRYMLLTTYLGCGVMAIALVVVLLDQIHVGKTEADPEFSQSSWKLCLATAKMLKDTKCLLLMPLVVFVGLEQGFIFGDFTKSYVACAMEVYSIGEILMCYGAVSAVSSITIGCFSKHIKRFAFIAAGAMFNIGLLVVLWRWKPKGPDIDMPNFFVVASCLGLCDAIWQTQTYTLFGVLFSHKQEAAFASYRMFHAWGCAVAFGYSHFLCVEYKVFILAGTLFLALSLYSVIEMRVQLQSQDIGDIVAL